MHRQQPTSRTLTFALVAAALILSGCEATSNWLKGRKTAEASDIVGIDGERASPYLVELEQLSSGDLATQAEIVADAESAATLTPGTSTRLRYALVMASPGHAGTDPAAAQGILRDLLTQPELMTATEVALARIFLNNIETQIVLNTEARRLRAENTRAATTEEAAVAQRMARIEAENRQLREQLSDAESKLEAITSIERSMREQADAPDPR
jgi:hypothetical protein